MANPTNHVQEMQGLYGPFTIAERVVQKIWLRRDFATDRAALADGRKLEIRSSGTWNLLGGPDFHGARVAINGVAMTGDVEVHFHVSDWRAHGHAADRAYGNVVLHVVMFPPAEGEAMARRGDGVEIPTLVLLPLLHRSLEEHASDDALEKITERDATERIAELVRMPAGELRRVLLEKAEARWVQKRRFAALRVEKLGWTAAMHQTGLEILGYRHNRAAMLAVAARHPLAEWAEGLDIDEIFREREGQWQLQGVRPANHPRLRLRQYQGWVERQPDWPETLRRIILQANTPRRDAPPLLIEGSQIQAAEVPSGKRGARQGGVYGVTGKLEAFPPRALTELDIMVPTASLRKQAGLAGWREELASQVAGDAIGGTRLDTMICDGFLPLAAEVTGRDLLPVWFHWFMGDVPREVRRALRETGIAGHGKSPFCHGWGQGLLGWLLEREARASG